MAHFSNKNFVLKGMTDEPSGLRRGLHSSHPGSNPSGANRFFFKKWAIPGLFFCIFVFSMQLTVNVQYKILPMTGFDHGPLESEATALPTEPTFNVLDG